MSQREVVIGSRIGLHARPAAMFVQAATACGVPVTIGKAGTDKTVNAKSILAVLALGAKGGETVVLAADGEGADQALDELEALLLRDLDTETETADA